MSERPKVRRPRRVEEPQPANPVPVPAPEIPAPVPAAKVAPVTADTPMRSIGDLPLSVWRAELARLNSPMLAEVEEIVRAVSPHGALGLTQAARESTYGTAANARARLNAWGLMVRKPGPSELQRFGSWAEGAAEFAHRLSDEAAPYDPAGISVRDYLLTYVGGPLCRSTGGRTCANGETLSSITRYTDAMLADLNRLRQAGPGADPAPDPWRPYPWPKMVDLVVPKPGENAGFTRCAPRGNRIRGFCTHITDGPPSQTIEFFRDFFGTGGARAWDALTDLVIGWDGRIGLLNDWRDPNRGGTRAGWANGGVDGLEGEGVAFYRAFPAINEVLVSCEHAQKAGGAWSDAMLASTIEVRTALAQSLRCPAEAYPFHPAFGGVSIEQQHRNFATKSCPANPYIGTYDAVVRREVKAKLRAWQGGGASVPVEPEPTYTRFGFTKEAVEQFFGTITRFNKDGTTDEFGFDWGGALSLFWLKRAEATGIFPEAERIWFMDAAHIPGKDETWASFEGGLTAYLPAGERAAWQWLDRWTEG